MASARRTRVAAPSLGGVPPAARVELSCRGGGCPFKTKTVTTRGAARVSLTRAALDVANSQRFAGGRRVA